MSNTVLVITGQTGTGKTDLSLSIAARMAVEIISADSRQVYRGMDIGTDKLSIEKRSLVPHHLIDVVDPDEAFTAADFKQRAEERIAHLLSVGKVPVVCGGTALYIHALEHGLFSGPGRNEAIRSELCERSRRLGPETLHRELVLVDPAAAARIHPNDSLRVVRALEVFYMTGVPISEHQEKRTKPSRFRFLKIGLCFADSAGYKASLHRRVEVMIEKGLIEEVRGLLDAGYSETLPAMQAPGYRHIPPYLAGTVSLEQATARMKTATWRFARRQWAWLRRDQAVRWFRADQFSSTAALADVLLEQFHRELGR